MAPPARLYLVTRGDLPAGQQAVQAAHALRQWVAEQPALDAQWFATSTTLALLTTTDEPALEQLARRAGEQGLAVAAFREPDRGGELTAIAIEPRGRKLVRRLPLALQG